VGRLDGKTAVITDGSGGIGKKTAELFLKEGARVSLVDLHENGLLEAKKELKKFCDILTTTSNITEENQVQEYVKKN